MTVLQFSPRGRDQQARGCRNTASVYKAPSDAQGNHFPFILSAQASPTSSFSRTYPHPHPAEFILKHVLQTILSSKTSVGTARGTSPKSVVYNLSDHYFRNLGFGSVQSDLSTTPWLLNSVGLMVGPPALPPCPSQASSGLPPPGSPHPTARPPFLTVNSTLSPLLTLPCPLMTHSSPFTHQNNAAERYQGLYQEMTAICVYNS